MSPAIVTVRIRAAKAVAENLRTAAQECADKPVVAARFVQAAQTIDEMIALLESATFVAKLNHHVIMESAR